MKLCAIIILGAAFACAFEDAAGTAGHRGLDEILQLTNPATAAP